MWREQFDLKDQILEPGSPSWIKTVFNHSKVQLFGQCIEWSKDVVNLIRFLNPITGLKKRIRETKHLSTDADSSTDTIVRWTKNTQKTNYFEKRKKSSKMQKLKNV